MSYFKQYEKIKDLRKEVPTNSNWRLTDNSRIRYKVLETPLHGDGYILTVKFRVTDLMDESYSRIGIISFHRFINSLEREN